MLIQSMSIAFLMNAWAGQQPQGEPRNVPRTPTAEQQRDTDPGRYQASRFADLETLADAKVAIMADADERAEAARDGERADRPECSIDELLIDHHDGRIVAAVLSVGGFLGIGDKQIAVPFSSLRWNESDENWTLSATKAELESMREFDMKRAREHGVDATLLKNSKGMPIESASTKSPAGTSPFAQRDGKDHASKDNASKKMHGDVVMVDDKPYKRAPNRLCLASKLDGMDVHGPDEKVGEISRLFVDRQSNNIAFVVVSHGGVAGIGEENYLVPFKALTYCRADDGEVVDAAMTDNRLDDAGDGKRVLCMDRAMGDLKTMGVRYEEPEEGVLDGEAARRADRILEQS